MLSVLTFYFDRFAEVIKINLKEMGHKSYTNEYVSEKIVPILDTLIKIVLGSKNDEFWDDPWLCCQFLFPYFDQHVQMFVKK